MGTVKIIIFLTICLETSKINKLMTKLNQKIILYHYFVTAENSNYLL